MSLNFEVKKSEINAAKNLTEHKIRRDEAMDSRRQQSPDLNKNGKNSNKI